MNKFIFNIIFLCVVPTYVFTKKIPLVWQVPRAQFWEEDWLRDILQGVELISIEDGHYEKFIDNSIIVVSSLNNTEGCIEYFEEMHNKGYTFGIINISDERELGPYNFYPYAAFVFRNYWRKCFDSQQNVKTFPLGYGEGFWEGGKKEPEKACNRKYVWSFFGMIRDRSTRKSMIDNMKKIPNYFFLETSSWGRLDPKSLTVPECRELMLKTIFIPCPGGWVNMDTFRLYESLECGCIPIVENFPQDYFRNFFPDHPFITIDSWKKASDVIKAYMADPEALEKKRLECYIWWQAYKQNLNQTLVSIVKQKLCFE
jgi:hypothetical protein